MENTNYTFGPTCESNPRPHAKQPRLRQRDKRGSYLSTLKFGENVVASDLFHFEWEINETYNEILQIDPTLCNYYFLFVNYLVYIIKSSLSISVWLAKLRLHQKYFYEGVHFFFSF